MGSDSFNSIESFIGGNNQDFIKFKGTDSSGGFQSVLGGVGEDKFLANGSASSFATLDGGSGNDDFVFTMVPASPFHIGGFRNTRDKFVFARANFNGDANDYGALDAGTFVSGVGAVVLDSDDFSVFDTTTNTLSYDADGNGASLSIASRSMM